MPDFADGRAKNLRIHTFPEFIEFSHPVHTPFTHREQGGFKFNQKTRMNRYFAVQLFAILGLSVLAGQIHLYAGLPEDALEADKTLAPYFKVLHSGGPESSPTEEFPLQSTRAEVKISGVIANVEVRQVYQNRGKETIEAIYVFPGSTRAAVHGLTLKIEDRTVEAEIQERGKAKKTYEKAKSEGKTASLLEQQRPNVFQMNVANILPGDTVEAILRYTEYVVPTDKVYEFSFPTVVGPRYAGSSSGDQHQWVENPFLGEGVSDPTTFDISVTVDAGMPIQDLACDTHPTDIAYEEASRATVNLTGEKTNSGNRDFILHYRLADKAIQSGLILHEGKDEEENFFLLTVQPPKRVTPRQIPPREYIFVVDVSGSMNGFPLDTAKELMSELFSTLETTDKFNILAFAGGSEVYATHLVNATEKNRKDALRWMNGRQSGGGTELVKALERAISFQGEENVSRSVVVVTDGYVSFERDAFDLIEKNLGKANLFAFGIGSSVNRYLIDGMARVGRGEPFVVTDPKFAPEISSKLKKYIASPVLTNIELDFGDFDVYDVEPTRAPDILADRPLTVFGKWQGKPEGSIHISGTGGDGNFDQSVKVESPSTRQPALPYLWARDRIARLADYKGPQNDDPELKQQITNLGLTYGLLTEYTSFVAVDTKVRHAGSKPAKPVKQPLPLPAGVPASAVGGGGAPGPGIVPLLIVAISALFGRRIARKQRA